MNSLLCTIDGTPVTHETTDQQLDGRKVTFTNGKIEKVLILVAEKNDKNIKSTETTKPVEETATQVLQPQPAKILGGVFDPIKSIVGKKVVEEGETD